MAAIASRCFKGFSAGNPVSGVLDRTQNPSRSSCLGFGRQLTALSADRSQQTSEVSVQLKSLRSSRVSTAVYQPVPKVVSSATASVNIEQLIRAQPIEEVVALVKSHAQNSAVSDKEARSYSEALVEAHLAAVEKGKRLHDVETLIAALRHAGLHPDDAIVIAVVYSDILVERLNEHCSRDPFKLSKVPPSLPSQPLMAGLLTFPSVPENILVNNLTHAVEDSTQTSIG